MINPLTGQVQPWWYSSNQDVDTESGASGETPFTTMGGADSLLISQRAKQLYQYAEQAKGMTGSELKDLLQEETGSFKSDVKQFLEDNGFSTDPAVELTLGEDGAIKVLGEHEDAEAMEKLLNESPELAERMQRLKNLDGLQDELTRRREFMREYSRNPYATVAMYSNTGTGAYLMPEQEQFSLMVGAVAG